MEMPTSLETLNYQGSEDVNPIKVNNNSSGADLKQITLSKEQLDDTKTSGKQVFRRRKGNPKPRRICQIESDVAFEKIEADGRKGKSLDFVLQQVLKTKGVEDTEKDITAVVEDTKMIDVQESISIRHHHSPKSVRTSATSPGSVGSPDSLYSNERAEDNLSDNGVSHSPEPFVKIPSRNTENIKLEIPPSYDAALPRSLPSDVTQRRRSASPTQVSSPRELAGSAIIPGGVPLSQQAFSFRRSSIPYNVMSANPSSAIAAMAAGMGLPTMISSSTASMIPPFLPLSEQHCHYEGTGFMENKTKDESDSQQNKGTFRTTARGIIGSSATTTRPLASPPPEERAQYKRPPHTYPALIASAILDSPGHLITLRGIYDYIMNHFPYYKYCHDKSAWQNSIRHNLSLNQCFVKVPRYENAAKSNYWTMTREGFEEFGNENSFKRRRRRGATLAPISAYKAMKAKKYPKYPALRKDSNEGTQNEGKSKMDATAHHLTVNSASTGTSVADVAFHSMAFPSQLMGLAGGVWSQENNFQKDENEKKRKRSQSPSGSEMVKHPRMLVLKQGDGPSLSGIKREDPKRPNSLSSVEEMQGTLNSFSKTLLDTSRNGETVPHLQVSNTQPWVSAAQKNLIATSGMMMPSLIAAGTLPLSPEKNGLVIPSTEEGYASSESPIVVEGIEVGSEVTIRYDASEMPIRHFRCGFCSYAYVSTSGALLEQHARMMHQLELTNAKVKAVAQKQSDRNADSAKLKESSERLVSLQNMVSGGISPRTMMVNAQNFFAAAQGNGGVSSFPYSGTFPSGLLDEGVMRSLAEQASVGQTTQVASDYNNNISNMDAYTAYHQRQQVLNSALHQAAAASTTTPSQDPLRLFYQQLAMHPFLANQANGALAAASFSRQVPSSEADQTNQFKPFWEYQKLIHQMKAMSDENGHAASNSPSNRSLATQADEASVVTQLHRASPGRSSSNPDLDAELKKSIHAWKQCARCNFTAKGDHGLDLHYRKAHAQTEEAASSAVNGVDDVTDQATPNLEISTNEHGSKDKISANYQAKFEQCGSPLTSSTFPTPPLSNSPSYLKRNFTPLDLSGVKEDDDVKKSSKTIATSSTQTVTYHSKEDHAGSRTCRHCDIVFGDDMMMALHMSCHDKTDPFKCTICGQGCQEKYYFNVHLLRGLHQNNNNSNNNNTNSCGRVEQTPEEVSDGEVNSCSRRNSSETSSVTTPRGRLNSDNSETASYQ